MSRKSRIFYENPTLSLKDWYTGESFSRTHPSDEPKVFLFHLNQIYVFDCELNKVGALHEEFYEQHGIISKLQFYRPLQAV